MLLQAWTSDWDLRMYSFRDFQQVPFTVSIVKA